VAAKSPQGKSMMEARILTIGHSNHALERFIALIEGADVGTVADVRSKPVSRFVPHFSRASLEAVLAERGISYLFLGAALGGRPDDPSLMKHGKPDYAAMARTPGFASWLKRVIEESAKRKVALLCAERDPIDCHRFRLVGRELAARQIEVAHILSTGEIEPHAETERRARGNVRDDLFNRS
jgi:uncharacterized protein (DUF488 family)